MKELPRIPRVATYEQFMAFVEAGQELARLHVHFEDVAPYAGVKFEYTKVGQPSYRVTQTKWGKIKGKTGTAAKDKTTLIYNDWITVKNIPLEAQEYVVNKKSALDWVVERLRQHRQSFRHRERLQRLRGRDGQRTLPVGPLPEDHYGQPGNDENRKDTAQARDPSVG